MGRRQGGRQGGRLAIPLLLMVLTAHVFCASASRPSMHSARRLAQAGTNTVVTTGNAMANTGNNNFVGAAQQAVSNPQNAQNANLAAKQLVTSATGNQQVNSNDLNSLIQGVRLTQTLNQFLQSIAGSSNKQTALHSTLESQNIAGLYKQQQTDDQFKVGSPSGSVYWTAGSQPVPAPAQAAANNFVTAVAPSLNDVTNSLIALIPSPPPPPPPPTVIQALAPLEEAASNRIASFLTDSGNSAKAGSSTTNGQASSFQQQALPTIAVPTTFTHEAFSGAGSAADATNSDVTGRKLKQTQYTSTPQQQQQEWAPASYTPQQQAQWSPAQQQQQYAPANTQQQYYSPPAGQQQQWSAPQAQQQQQQYAPAANTNSQQSTPASGASNGQPWYSPQAPQQQQQWYSPQAQQQQQQPQWYSPQAQQQQYAPITNTQQQQTFGSSATYNANQSKSPQYSGATSQTTQSSGIANAQQWPAGDMVQLSDGRWVPASSPSQQAAYPNQGTGAASAYGASSTNSNQQQQGSNAYGSQGSQYASATAPAPAPASPRVWSFPPVTINGVNLPGWSLPKWVPTPPAPPLGPAPAMAKMPQAPQPLPLPNTQPAAAHAPASSSVASFQTLTNTQGQPLTKSLAEASALPQLQQIGVNPDAPNSVQQAGPQPTILQTTGAVPAQQPGGLPGFPAQGPALPNNNLLWVNVGGNGQKSG